MLGTVETNPTVFFATWARLIGPEVKLTIERNYAASSAAKRLGRRRGGVGFLSNLRSLRATMSQKSSVPQAVGFVSQVLKRDMRASAKQSRAARAEAGLLRRCRSSQ